MNKTPWAIVAVVIVAAVLIGAAVWHYSGYDTDNYQTQVYSTSSPSTTGSDNPVTSTVTVTTTTTYPTATSTRKVVGAGEHCGGNMMNPPVCGTGYQCTPTPGSHLPFGDVGGTCVAIKVQGSASY